MSFLEVFFLGFGFGYFWGFQSVWSRLVVLVTLRERGSARSVSMTCKKHQSDSNAKLILKRPGRDFSDARRKQKADETSLRNSTAKTGPQAK